MCRTRVAGQLSCRPVNKAVWRWAARLLMIQGAAIDLQRNTGSTALMKASKNAHLEVVRLLLDQGAATELRDHDGLTALRLASDRLHEEVALLLFQRVAADVTVVLTLIRRTAAQL